MLVLALVTYVFGCVCVYERLLLAKDALLLDRKLDSLYNIIVFFAHKHSLFFFFFSAFVSVHKPTVETHTQYVQSSLFVCVCAMNARVVSTMSMENTHTSRVLFLYIYVIYMYMLYILYT